MTADNDVFRGRPLIGAARQRFPRANWCGRPRGGELGGRFQREQTCFVMLKEIENLL